MKHKGPLDCKTENKIVRDILEKCSTLQTASVHRNFSKIYTQRKLHKFGIDSFTIICGVFCGTEVGISQKHIFLNDDIRLLEQVPPHI